MPIRFAWDARKAHANLRKHGVSFEEAATAFDDPLSLTTPDPDHSFGEERFILIGRLSSQLLVVVVHVERDDTIQIISARPASRRERVTYEKTD